MGRILDAASLHLLNVILFRVPASLRRSTPNDGGEARPIGPISSKDDAKPFRIKRENISQEFTPK
jgi:hypothetical protein